MPLTFEQYVVAREYIAIEADYLMNLPVGDDAQRPTGPDLQQGSFRFSSEQNTIEWYNGTAWKQARDYTFDNGIVIDNTAQHIQFGGQLLHPTTLDADSSVMTFAHNQIYNYGFLFSNRHQFQDGTGILAFIGKGTIFDPITHVPLAGNFVRLGIDYTEDLYGYMLDGITPISGYMGDKIGYYLGTNKTGHGSFGEFMDEGISKSTGVFFHTKDTGYTDAITIYGIPTSAYTNASGTYFIGNGVAANYRIFTAHTDKAIQYWGYPSTRDDGVNAGHKVLYTDTNGKMKIGKLSSVSGSFTSQDGKTITVTDGIITAIV